MPLATPIQPSVRRPAPVQIHHVAVQGPAEPHQVQAGDVLCYALEDSGMNYPHLGLYLKPGEEGVAGEDLPVDQAQAFVNDGVLKVVTNGPDTVPAAKPPPAVPVPAVEPPPRPTTGFGAQPSTFEPAESADVSGGDAGTDTSPQAHQE